MPSSSYCQGIQSGVGPAHVVEPLVVRLKLAPPKFDVAGSSTSRSPSFASYSNYDTKGNDNVNNIGGWNFLQCLANETSQTAANETTEKDKLYVPPSFKRSSTLSEKSLEMCTESLGNETGSEVSENIGDHVALVSIENGSRGTREKLKLGGTRRPNLNRSVSFPPPLTSFSGPKNVQLRPNRNEGRLVLEAVAVSPSHGSFLAERINGRLRLHLVKNNPPYDPDNKEEQVEAKEETDEEEEEEEEEEEACGEKVFDVDGEDLHGNSGIIGGEKTVKLARPSRCKEGGSRSGSGNKDMLDWEPFCVAT